MSGKNALTLTLVLVLGLVLVSPCVLGQAKPQPPSKLEKAPAPVPDRAVPTIKACAELIPAIRVRKSLQNSVGKITLVATICNRGAGAYSTPPGQAVAYFWRDFRYPPQSIGQTGIASVSLGNKAIPALAPGECTTIQKTDTLRHVAAWGKGPPEGNQKPAEAIYTVRLGRADAIQSDLTRGEDCNPQNNRASQPLPYVQMGMIRIPRR